MNDDVQNKLLAWYEKTYGGKAFPDQEGSGMTLRDYFAAKAMTEVGWWNKKNDGSALLEGAKLCYKIADSMLAERVREKK